VKVRAQFTTYAVAGWGVGELWTGDGVVLAHEFRFGAVGAVPAERVGGDPDGLIGRLQAFLAGEDVDLRDVPIDLGWATPFQHAVAAAVRTVPRGEVVSYGELAAHAGYPGAARAAGSFCAHNRFMFILPCHRVVGATGLGGYGSAGVAVKRRLLALEGVVL
jgi:methylated-DNA-[protein]-cysteine S-methyltransferase